MTFGEHAIAHADVLTALRELPDSTFDALLTDPPYGFRFMGKRWDYDVPSVDVWREAFRVLKPGAPLLSFGGARTFHRIAIGIEDAGFELRDCLTWLYAKGFPKSLNVSKAIDKAAGAVRPVVGTRTLTGNAAVSLKDKGGTYGVQVGTVPAKTVDVTSAATDLAQQWEGYGTALKPGWEPIILARKPLEGTVVENVKRWGTGALAIDACRIGDEIRFNQPAGNKPGGSSYNLSLVGMPDDAEGRECVGRWPGNVVMDEEAGAILDAEVGNRPSRPSVTRNGGGNAGGSVFANRETGVARADSGRSENGGPSRFFFSAKVSTKEREYGCETLPIRSAGEVTDRRDGSDGLDSPRAGAGRTSGARNHHPTLKPLALANWLAALIKPPTPDATLLVPYSGAGSEIIGALQAGWPMVFGIEGEAEYVDIAHARIAAWGRKAA